MAVQSAQNGEAWVDNASTSSTGALAFLTLFLSSKPSLGKPSSDKYQKREGSGKASEASESEKSASRYETKEQEIYNHIAKYAKPDDGVGMWIAAQTLIVYCSLFYLSYTYSGPLKWPLTALFTILCGFTRTRVFVVMHDMAHHSFFSSRIANVVCATVLGALVYTPYRHSNNTDRKQIAQTAPLTVAQYKQLPRWRQIGYNFIYGHWTLITTTPWIYFVFVQRLMSKWYENALIGVYWWWILSSGDSRLITTDILTAAIGASLGVFLFHIQHTFEGAYKAPNDNYSRFENGMHGSSYLIVPEWFKWFTAAIEYHNVHHLNTRVPLYRLRKCFEEGSALFEGVPTFTIWQALQRLPYSLRHDEDRTFLSCYDVSSQS